MLELARVFEILYAIDEQDLVASMAADLGDKATDTAGLVSLADIATHHGDARAVLLIGKSALGRGLPLERFAFPDFGVPDYQQIGPRSSAAWSFDRAPGKRFQSAGRLERQCDRADAGHTGRRPRYRERFNVTYDQRRLMSDVVYNAQLGTAELGDDIGNYRGSYILAFVSYNAGRRRAKEWIEQYGDPRDGKWTRSTGSSGSPSRRRAITLARDRKHAGLSGPAREQSQAPDRGRPAARRLSPCSRRRHAEASRVFAAAPNVDHRFVSSFKFAAKPIGVE